MIRVAGRIACKKEKDRLKNFWNQLKTSYYINSEYIFRKL